MKTLARLLRLFNQGNINGEYFSDIKKSAEGLALEARKPLPKLVVDSQGVTHIITATNQAAESLK